MRLTPAALLLLTLFFFSPSGLAGPEQRLVILISIDQFPDHYLTRFEPYFGEGGFRRLMSEGAVFTEARYDYASTFTGSGHATIATGAYPHLSGIVGNNWYDQEHDRAVYCAEDSSVSGVGVAAAGRSPALLLRSTVGDELRNTSGSRSRVFSVSQKDRSAIFLGGKKANAAYWLSDSLFITSTYYMETLPEWVRRFNAGGLATSYFGSVWEKSLPDDAYRGMDADDAPYEGGGRLMGRAFPHRIDGGDTTGLTPAYFSALWNSPFLNDLMIAFVKELITEESLGMKGTTDLLCIGLSANDAVGHTFGPESQEVLDMTVRTDRLLAGLFDYIDASVGLDHCIIALTSDHGIAPIPEWVTSHVGGRPAGRTDRATVAAMCERFLDRSSGHPDMSAHWVSRVVDGNIYLNRQMAKERGLDLDEGVRLLADSLSHSELIGAVLARNDAETTLADTGIRGRLSRSFFGPRSGEVVYALPPYFIDFAGPGTDHGQPYEYDTHVPVMFYGAGIAPGEYHTRASPVDIAPTLAELLGLRFPDTRDGRVLREALR